MYSRLMTPRKKCHVLVGAACRLESVSEESMKYRIIGLVAVASLVNASAQSADLTMPAQRYTKAPVAPVVVDPWTGFYAGLNVGYGWGNASATAVPNTALTTAISEHVDGAFGGGQFGYNWLIDRRWLFGLEADIQGSGARGSSTDRYPTFSVGVTQFSGFSNSSTSLPWFGTFRGRTGFLVDPSLLLYATGGVAFGEVKFTTQPNLTMQGFDGVAPFGPLTTISGAAVSDSHTRVGWTVGAGIEKKFDPHWSAKLEYLYVDLGSTTYLGSTVNQTGVGFHDQIVRAGFNYQFAPVSTLP